MSKPIGVGAYVHQRLNLVATGKAHGGNAKASNRTWVLEIFDNLDLMRRTMALTDAATALRVSEILALKWNDLDFIDHLIRVRRACVDRRFGPPKSKASKAPVPMHPLLAAHLLAWRKETLYPGDEDFVFPVFA
jgi:integrase